jgi:hypothetical protein
MKERPTRYFFPWAAPAARIPLLSAILLVAAVLLALADQSAVALAVAAGLGLFGAISYRLRRDQVEGFYAELGERALKIQLLVSTSVSYEDIQAVEPRRYSMSEPKRRIVNLILSSGNIAGSNWSLEGRKGEIDPGGVVLLFKRSVWFSVLYPPFRIPVKKFELKVGDASSFVRDLADRLAE